MDRASRGGRPSLTSLWQRWFAVLIALYRRPAAFLCLLFVVPLISTSAWICLVNEREWRAQESQDLLTAARLAARTIQEEFERTQRIGAAMMAHPEERDALLHRNRPMLDATLRRLLDVSAHIDRARVIDAQGRVMAEARAERLDEAGDDAAALPWPSIAPVSGVYLSDGASREKVVAVTSPIEQDGALIGAVQVQYRLEEIAGWLEKIRIEPSGFLYVTDQRGLLVAYPFQLLPGAPKNVSAWPPVAAPLSAAGRIVRFKQGRPPQPWTAAVVAVDSSGWRVVAQQADRHLLGPFRKLLWSFTLLMALAGGLVGLMARRWVRLHRATLRLLAQQTRLLQWSEQRRLQTSTRRRRGLRGTPDAS